jgi:hypothetical protein
MTHTTTTQALDAATETETETESLIEAQEFSGSGETAAGAPGIAADAERERDDAPDDGGAQQAGTPLEKITDWDELERRLRVAETEPAEDTSGESAEETPPRRAPGGDLEDGDAPPPTGQDSPGAKPLARNFRLRAQDPQRAQFYQLLRQHPDANPADLARMAGYAGAAPAPDPAKNEEPKHDAAREADPLQSLRDQVADLSRRKREHREAYEFDKADELGEQLLETRLELERKAREVAENHVAQAHYDAAYHEARNNAAQLHPATVQAGSKQFRLVRMLVAAKEQEAPEFFADPAYPLHLLSELERDFPEAFPPRRSATARRDVAARPPSRLVGQAVAGTTGGSHATSRVELERQIENLSPEQLYALADAVGTQPGDE